MAEVHRVRKVTVVLAVLAVLSPAVARAAGEMTLDECVARALDRNPSVINAREAVARARGGIIEARSGFLPNLSLSGSYNFLEEVQTIELPDPITGQTVESKLDFTRDYQFRLTLSQSLYTGGRLGSSYSLARRGRDMARSDLDLSQAEVAMEVIRSFYQLLLAREGVEVTGEAIRTAEEFLRVVKARYETGEASHFEVLRAEVEVANLEPALISATNGVALSELALKRTMNLDQEDEVDFIGEFQPVGFEIRAEQAIEIALANRPELESLRVQEEMAEQSIRLAKAGRLPTLSASFNYDVLTNTITLDSDELDKTYAGYLNLSVPIFDGLKTRSQIAQAESDLRSVQTAMEELESAIELEVRSRLLEIQAARERLDSQEMNVGLAQEGLDIANQRYLQGYATNLEVMDAQLALVQARQNRLEALHDLNLAVAEARKAMGVLLED
jgi:outer membrane protein TolC